MVTLQTASILFFLGIILFVIGKQYGNYIIGILGGLTIFLTGVIIIIEPVINISTLMNTVAGFILFGLGAYVWVSGTQEAIWNGDEAEA